MADHRPRTAPARGALGITGALLLVCVLAAAPLLLYRTVSAVTQRQEQVLHAIQQALEEVKLERDEARKQVDELSEQTRQLAGLQVLTDEIKFDLEKHRRQFSPSDKISDQPASAIVRIDSKGQFVASPSIVKLPEGRLLVALERAVSWGVTKETTMKLIYSSDDGGSSWQRAAVVGPMNWPQIFRCASGTYLLGVERHFSRDNNLVISKMLDDKGTSWSVPARLTKGLSIVSANNGVDVSGGRVTKALELIPGMAVPRVTTQLAQDVRLEVAGGVGSSTWEHQPVVDLPVASVAGFVSFTLVKVPLGSKAVFFRIQRIDPAGRVLRARLERFNLFWQQEGVVLPANSTLEVASGALVYGGVDWVASAISADENADLRDPAAWTLAHGIGNPASMHSNEMRAMFDAAFRGDVDVRKSIIGFDVKGLNTGSAWEAGFGSLYWMEGVVTRQRDRHGGDGKLLSIMRVNNDLLCDLAALVEYDDTSLQQPQQQQQASSSATGNATGAAAGGAAAGAARGELKGRFLRYAFVPGLGVGHPAIQYDEVSDLYWMASNVNRDANRRWKQPKQASGINPVLHITAFSKCEVDRSTLGLYYSSNLLSWTLAGMIDYHISLARHFAYPHMIVEGSDLLVVSRAAFAPWARNADVPLNEYYNNHNSNTVAFHRVKNFRHYANIEWANHQGEYSAFPRRATMMDEKEEESSFAADIAKRQAAAEASAAADAKAHSEAVAGVAAAVEAAAAAGAAAAAAGTGAAVGGQGAAPGEHHGMAEAAAGGGGGGGGDGGKEGAGAAAASDASQAASTPPLSAQQQQQQEEAGTPPLPPAQQRDEAQEGAAGQVQAEERQQQGGDAPQQDGDAAAGSAQR